ncbi:MAG TPA: C1 family peptidase [Patescibacteria group bacterium]|nr:C1 family peptidase [Patescibacteria group bacterium]
MLSSRPAAVLAVVIVVIAACAAFAEGATGLSPGEIKELRESFELDAGARALLNAVTNNNDTRKLTYNREILLHHDDVYDFKLDAKGITDQKQSGRCWLFAGFNVMRPAVRKRYNIENFEFSESHLFFWDKLEKANMFLEAIIETRDRDIDDRELQTLLENPVPDGGWWSYVVTLIDKYGAVPKSVMPETEHSSSTKNMNALLDRLMRSDAAKLRRLAADGEEVSALHDLKKEMLKDVYRILAFHLGVPPERFTWRFEDKDDNIVEQEYTPLSFYREAVGVDLSEYVSIFDHPAHPYGKYYRIRYCRNMTGAPDMDFINMDIAHLKKFALDAVMEGEPVWFSADVGKGNDGEHGILAVGMYDYGALFGIDPALTKAERVQYRGSTPNHAMVLIGVDIDDGKPVKWLVENSWGTDRGDKGRWAMYDDWFDEYVYTVIIHKRYLPGDVLDLLDTEPEILPAWDQMREAFR